MPPQAARIVTYLGHASRNKGRLIATIALHSATKGRVHCRNCNHASHKGVLWTRAERYCEHNYLSEGQRALLVQALLVRWAHRLHHNQQHDDSHIGEGKLGLGLVFRVN